MIYHIQRNINMINTRFFSETMETQRQWNDILRVSKQKKKKTVQQEFYIQQKQNYPTKSQRQNKDIPRYTKTEFTAGKPASKKLVKDVIRNGRK